MILRIWTTGIVKEKIEAYKAFAQNSSMPMFKQFEGLIQVYMGMDEEAGVSKVITIWKDQQSIDQMETSNLYQETVQRILETGFVTGPQSVELMKVFDYSLA